MCLSSKFGMVMLQTRLSYERDVARCGTKSVVVPTVGKVSLWSQVALVAERSEADDTIRRRDYQIEARCGLAFT